MGANRKFITKCIAFIMGLILCVSAVPANVFAASDEIVCGADIGYLS